LNGNQTIEKMPYLGIDQFYLYQGSRRIKLLDPEEVDELLTYL
jgi:hypothetical protein